MLFSTLDVELESQPSRRQRKSAQPDLLLVLTFQHPLLARTARLSNVNFVVSDLQLEGVTGAPFGAAISQFGVMFFDDPVQGLANIRHQLRPAARFSFVCWQPLGANAWHLNHAVGQYLPSSTTNGPRPGPFSMADYRATTELLRAAGWQAIDRIATELDVTVGRDAIVDDDQLSFIGIAPEHLDAARRAVDAHLAQFQRRDGNYGVTIATQLFTCTA